MKQEEEEKKEDLKALTHADSPSIDNRESPSFFAEVRDADIVPSFYAADSAVPTRNQQVFQDLFGHKTSFVPLRRDLYESLLRKDNHRAGKAEFFEALDDIPDRMTVPTDQTLNQIDLNELFVKIELRAVLKIRLLFTQWVQQLVSNTLGQFDEHFAASTETGAGTSVKGKQPQLQRITTTAANAQDQDPQESD